MYIITKYISNKTFQHFTLNKNNFEKFRHLKIFNLISNSKFSSSRKNKKNEENDIKENSSNIENKNTEDNSNVNDTMQNEQNINDNQNTENEEVKNESKPKFKIINFYEIKSKKLGPPLIDNWIDKSKFIQNNVKLRVYNKNVFFRENKEHKQLTPVSPKLGPFEVLY
jgi:hypothetical protein